MRNDAQLGEGRPRGTALQKSVRQRKAVLQGHALEIWPQRLLAQLGGTAAAARRMITSEGPYTSLLKLVSRISASNLALPARPSGALHAAEVMHVPAAARGAARPG